MSWTVRLSPLAEQDLSRLNNFLSDKNPRAARNALAAIEASVGSLSTAAERGRRASEEMREIRVLFGRDGYVVRYRIKGSEVFVMRIVHARELR